MNPIANAAGRVLRAVALASLTAGCRPNQLIQSPREEQSKLQAEARIQRIGRVVK